MMTIEEYQERIETLANEIEYNLIDTVVFQQLILQKDMEQEIDIYIMNEEKEISYNDLEYETRQLLENDGYIITDTTEYENTIGHVIADDIYATTENYRTSLTRIENELDYYDYPDELDPGNIIDATIDELTDYGYTITEYDEKVTPFQYHCTPNLIIQPFTEDKNKNIKGLELEISDDKYNIEEILSELANEHIIETATTFKNSTEIPNIALEEDGSVKYELIFRAQTNKKLLEELEKIQTLETIVKNHTGTSAHIHINRTYIEKELGLTEIDITKAAEFLNYPLFLISGRRKKTAHEWARSTLPCPIEANLAEKAKQVDRITKINYAKYNFINCSQEDTIELRIFSNKCNFNKNVINMYLETVDFIIELANYMKDKSYTKEFQNIIPLTKNHFEKFEDTLNFFNTKEEIMNEFKEPKTLLKTAIKNEWIAIDNEISRFIHHTQTEQRTYETIRRFISMVKTLNKKHECNYNLNINPEKTDIQQLTEKIRKDIRQTYEAKMEAI